MSYSISMILYHIHHIASHHSQYYVYHSIYYLTYHVIYHILYHIILKCTCCLIIDLMIYLILRVHFCRELFNYYKLDCKFLLSTNFFYYSFLSLSSFFMHLKTILIYTFTVGYAYIRHSLMHSNNIRYQVIREDAVLGVHS